MHAFINKNQMIKQIIPAIQLLCFLSSCSVIQKTAKQELTDGYYTQKSNTSKQQVYVDIVDETVRIYPVTRTNNVLKVDTAQLYQLYLPIINTKNNVQFSLSKKSFDVDFLTIPLKYRFAEKQVNPQLNANINGAVYFGYRTDRYAIRYKLNPLQVSERKNTHIGYSIGIFSGLGNTFMSPTNTNNLLQQEYDGMVWSKGIAGIFGVNSFTIGLSVGFDNLLDQNRMIWIYENKPWIGLVFGLNIN